MFFLARLRRIYPPYLLVSLLTVALSLSAALLVRHHLLPTSEIARLDFFHQNFRYYFAALTLTQFSLGTKPLLAVFWTLCYEISFYAIVGIAMALFARRTSGVMFHILHSLTLLCLVAQIVSPHTQIFPLNLYPQFGLGILVYAMLAHPASKSTKAYLIMSLLLMGIYGALGSRDLGGGKWTRCQSFMALGFALLLLVLYRFDARLTKLIPVRILSWVGIFSYSLYLTHLLGMGLVLQAGRRFGISETTYWISFILQILVSVAVARVLFQFIERPFLGSKRSEKPAQSFAADAPAHKLLEVGSH